MNKQELQKYIQPYFLIPSLEEIEEDFNMNEEIIKQNNFLINELGQNFIGIIGSGGDEDNVTEFNNDDPGEQLNFQKVEEITNENFKDCLLVIGNILIENQRFKTIRVSGFENSWAIYFSTNNCNIF